MKGQFVFEFIIAGMFFFAIVIYSINYLNVNVSDFKGDFYQILIQSKSIQISEMLMSESGFMSGNQMNSTKIDNFNSYYCNMSSPELYNNLIKDFQLYEKTTSGTHPYDINIIIVNSTEDLILYCGTNVPTNIRRAEISRYGLLEGDIVRTGVVLW